MSAPARLVALALLTLITVAAPAVAGPVIEVRARTRVDIDRVFAVGEDLAQVRGRLVDAVTGQGLNGLSLYLEIEGEEHMATTDNRGEFRAVFRVGPGPHMLRARFLGDDEYSQAEADYAFELGKETPVLTLGAPDEIEAGRPLELTVVSTVVGEPVPLTLFVAIGPATGTLTEVARGASDVGGAARFTVPPEDLGGAGDRRVRVIFKGNDLYNQASAEAHLRIMSTTRLEDLRAPSGVVAYESTIVLSGRLVDEAGRGVPGQAMVVRGGDERVAGTITAEDGRFETRLKASRFAAGPLNLQLEYVSTTPWRRGTKSQVMTLTVAEARPVPIGYTMGAFAVTFLGVMGFALARTQPWRPLVERWRARKKRAAGSGPAPAAPADAHGAPQTGLRPGRPSLMATLKRPADHGFSGVVRDAVTGRALGGARVWLELDGMPAQELCTDEGGRFEIDGLAAGTWRAGAAMSGYVSERFSVTVPHRGEMRDARIDLLPVREAVFQLYRRVVWGLLPRSEVWGVWTPREILDHVRKRRPGGALGALTDFVEEAYFSARTPEEDALVEARRRADAARAEVAPPGPRVDRGPAAT